MKHLYLSFVLLFCIFSFSAQAQMVDCNVFLQGHYIELAIGPNGAYGSTEDAPSGYHNNVEELFYHCDSIQSNAHGLGVVADPAEDGWDVGSPAYYGDFWMPGTPEEGWALQVGSTIINAYVPNFNSGIPEFSFGADCGSYHPAGDNVVGNNISFTDSAGILTSVWQGLWRNLNHYIIDTSYTTLDTTLVTYTEHDTVIDGTFIILLDSVVTDSVLTIPHYDTTGAVRDSILITQTTTLDTEGIYFIVQVTFTNLSDSPVHDVYYLRSIDPDNDFLEGGGYATVNASGAEAFAAVTATGVVHPDAYLALGSGDPSAQSFACSGGLSLISAIEDVFTHTAWVIDSGTITTDAGIGLAFNIGSIPGTISGGGGKMTSGGNSKTIRYFYSFNHLADSFCAAITKPTPDTTTYLRPLHQNNSVEASPNPFKTTLTIHGLSSTDHVLLYDMMGRSVSIYGNGSTYTVPDAPAGHYVLQVLDDKGSVKARQVVQKL